MAKKEKRSQKKRTITVFANGKVLIQATALFAAPLEAIQRQDLIRMWSLDEGPQGKFTLHTLAQQALFDFEDNELSVKRHPPETTFKAVFDGKEIVIPEGVVLAMDVGNRIVLHAQEGLEVMNLLRAIYRFATRMIRLDVR